MSGYRFNVRTLRSAQKCWLCTASLTKDAPAAWDNWNKVRGQGQPTCLSCAKKEQEAGNGEIKLADTETPATGAGASVNYETSQGGGSQIITGDIVQAIRELTQEFRLLREALTGSLPTSGLNQQPSTDFSPPEYPDLDIFDSKGEAIPLEDRFNKFLNAVKQVDEKAYELVKEHTICQGFGTYEIELRAPRNMLPKLEGKRRAMEKVLSPTQDLLIKERLGNS